MFARAWPYPQQMYPATSSNNFAKYIPRMYVAISQPLAIGTILGAFFGAKGWAYLNPNSNSMFKTDLFSKLERTVKKFRVNTSSRGFQHGGKEAIAEQKATEYATHPQSET